ncbi:hypothetical protein C5471_24045, partial [Photorhabdus tasmaniensis]|nr:hypothetical protein [Photorhabdus tasmaniensis]
DELTGGEICHLVMRLSPGLPESGRYMPPRLRPHRALPARQRPEKATRLNMPASSVLWPCLSYTNILTRPLVIELFPHRLISIKNTT